MMKPHTVGSSAAGKYARRSTSMTAQQTAGNAQMTTTELMAITKVPISGTTEISPIVEVLNMADYTHNTVSVVPMSEPIFQASPSSIVIREFQPQETVQVEICLRNNDNVARRVKIVQPESPCFTVELTQKKPSSKIAPGMDISYTLSFTPEERTDYFCDLVCYTEREKFIIPVRALGPRGWLDFPDEVFFDKAPVKAETIKTVLIRNVGDALSKFSISSSPPFTVTPSSAALEVGESMQLHFAFFPDTTDYREGQYRVDYSTGETVYINATGKAEELTVRIDSHALLMDPTYVTLFSQKTLKIINSSDETVQFSFKQLASVAEEMKARMRFGSTYDSGIGDEDADYDDSFQNESFSILPASGQVWPNSEVEITATFTPMTATEIACVAFCDIAGKQNRFPLHLQGTGIGAKIVLSYNVIDIGEVFINSVSEYEVELDNQGEIVAFYNLIPNESLFGSKFQFQPSEGMLGVGQKEHVKVQFSSDVLGEFSEDFEWSLQGSPKPLQLSFRGKVIGPTFHLDEQTLDFKRVSVAFLNTQHFHLFNTADIPFRFHMRVPGDGTLLKREFEVVPSSGTILPHGKQKIQVDFIPLTTRTYNLQLVMDVEGVGEQMASISVRANSIVPDVTVSTDELDYGDCFMRHPYKKVIELVNHSDLPAKFELQPQDDVSRCVAVYEADVTSGIIKKNDSRTITVSFTTERLNKVQLPMYFKIVGHEDTPLEVQCIANGIGPRLALNPPVVKWGDIDVLKNVERTLKVTNDSLIPAEIQTLVMKRGSRFKVDIPSLSLAPGEVANLKVTAFLDDMQPFRDELVLVVTEGGQVKVPLIAKGIGTTIFSEPYDLSNEPRVDIGDQFTSRNCKKSFVIKNRGPKTQTLTWFNGTAQEAAYRAKQAADGKKKPSPGDANLPKGEVFKVLINGSTEPFLIEPDATAVVDIIGFSKKAGSVTEKLCCRSKMDKSNLVIIEMHVTSNFVEPMVEFSDPVLSFLYDYEPEVPIQTDSFTQQITVTNKCTLPLQCNMKSTNLPFHVEPSDFDLTPFESRTVDIEFDPGYAGTKVSEEVAEQAVVQFNMGPGIEPKNEKAPAGYHPKKMALDLAGSINFPNLKFEKHEVKFDAILNDTTRRVKVKVTNTSKIQADYAWTFVVTDPSDKKRPGSSGTSIQSGRVEPPQPINAVFDILPTRSTLAPGVSEDIEFVYYGHANHKYRATAQCEVSGGPEYQVKLGGEASSIQYKFDRTSIDFGNVLYDKFAHDDITLLNTGKVKYDFTLHTSGVTRPSLVKCIPSRGVVLPGEKQKIQIQFQPGMPTHIATSITVNVAHFDPQTIVVTGKGVFPHVTINLPRLDPAKFARFLADAQEELGFFGGGMDTARTEGMPSATTRTMATDFDQTRLTTAGGESVGGGGVGERPPPSRGRTAAQRPQTVSLEQFVQTNPYVRQLKAEGDCLFMREFILDMLQEEVAAAEGQRGRTLFDEEAERKMLEEGVSVDEGGPAVPPGPGDGGAVVEQNVSVVSQLPVLDMTKFALADYVLDFGNVIKGQQQQKEFKVTNVGYSNVSFEFQKSLKAAMSQAGFTVEPDKVQRLPGAPDFETAEFAVVFNSAKPTVNLGPIDLAVPLQTRNGPTVRVHLRANVTIPDVDLSSDNLKFGSNMYVGHMRAVHVQLSNPKEIPATWSFGQALRGEGGSWKPCDDFCVIPAKGTLNPGETCNVQVCFTPRSAKEFNVKIPYKVAQNADRRFIRVSASSEALKIRFDPPLLELAPILPFVEESEQRVTMYNDTNARIEVYSVDFDERYHEEEEILRRVDGIYAQSTLGYQDVALLPLRQPEQPLQGEVLREWEPIEAAERKALEEEAAAAERAAAAAAAAAEGGEGEGGEGGDAQGGEEGANADGAGAGAGESEEAAAAKSAQQLFVEGAVGRLQPLEHDLPTFNAVVHSHPLAGGARLAAAMGKKFNVGVIDLQAVVDELLREAGVVEFEEEVPPEEEDGEATMQKVPGKWQLDDACHPTDVALEFRNVFFPPPPPPEEGEEPAAADDAEGEPEGPPEPRTAEVESGWLTEALLEKAIRRRMLDLDCVRGAVVKDLDVTHQPDRVVVAQAVKLAFASKTLHLIAVDHEKSPPGEEEPEGEEAPPAEGDDGGAAAAAEVAGGAEGEGEQAVEGGEEDKERVRGEDGQAVMFDDSLDGREFGGEGEYDEEGHAFGGMEYDDGEIQGEEVEEEEVELPEPVYSEEELAAMMGKYEADLQQVIEVYEPPPKEEGDEEAAPVPPAEGEEGERPRTPPPPTTCVAVRSKRVDAAPIGEVLMDLAARLPKPGPLPGAPRQLEIPPVHDREVVVRPSRRMPRYPVSNFYILTPVPVVPEEGEEGGEEGEPELDEDGEPIPKEIKYENKRVTRWVIEPQSSVELIVKMKATDTGRCEGVLGFEVQGGGVIMRGKEFGLPCRGVCAYPQMAQNHNAIFYRKMKTRAEGQIVNKQFIVSRNCYEFGPLLVGKDKEDFKTKYPENREDFRITNNGMFPMHVDLCFSKDTEGTTFQVEPAYLDLDVDETRDITVFAFTEEEGEFVDQLICTVKDNPEPFEINLSCVGSVPNIVTDIEPERDEEGEPVEGGPLKIEFQRLLLRRKDVRVVTITNNSLLAASWQLKNVGEEEGWNCEKEFSVFPVGGTLQPGRTEEVTIGFHAIEKEVFDKSITLEWIDVDSLLPEPKTLDIQVTAEAYEISFDFEFPAGEGVDFGTVKVADGGEQTFKITNNGKYQVGYKFAFARPKKSLAAKYFKIECADEGDYQGQSNGVLEPDGSTAEIKVIFDSKPFPGQEEVSFKDNMELKCYVSELLTGEEILTMPIKINVASVFSKYRVLPQKGIAFGALTYDTQKTRTFDIVNQGEFEFEYELALITAIAGGARSRPSTGVAGKRQDESDLPAVGADGTLKCGNFTVNPAVGTVGPGGSKQTVTVEFTAEGQQQFFEVLGIKISGRDPATDLHGMPYELSGESCIPGIVNSDFLQIFEEAAVWRKPSDDPNELIRTTFIEDERCFHFGPNMVSQRQEVRVKIVNPTKVPVNVSLSLTPKGEAPEGVFEIVENTLSLPMHEHRYATVYFTPAGLDTYSAVFEATVENGTDDKTNKLVFDIVGEGTLPRVTIRAPATRNDKGQAKVAFPKQLVGRSPATSELTIVNEGILPAKVRFGHKVGAWPPPEDIMKWQTGPKWFLFDGMGAELYLKPKEEKTYKVTFNPKHLTKKKPAEGEEPEEGAEPQNQQTFVGGLEMVVHSNEFERNYIELEGVAFTQDVSLDDLPEGSDDKLGFGDLPVGVSKTMTFAISNNSEHVYRFEWDKDESGLISFSPRVGHLQPRDTKTIVATVLATKKEARDDQGVPLKIQQIVYTEGAVDWDDSIKDVEWVTDEPGIDMNQSGGNSLIASPDDTLDVSLGSAIAPHGTSPATHRIPGRKGKPRKVTKGRPEPAYERVLVGDPPEEGLEDEREPVPEDEVMLKVSVNADYLSYAFQGPNEEDEIGDVTTPEALAFAETMMYRTREHTLQFKNTSAARMSVNWQVCHENGQADFSAEAPFLVSPEDAELAPGEVMNLVVRFAPSEVEQYRRKVVGFIKDLDTRPPKPEKKKAEGEEGEEAAAAGEEEEEGEAPPAPQVQPEILLTGKSARPFCHFELTDSDWLSSGRRPPNLTTPNGSAVDPNSHCVEFNSLGTQVRNTKRFFVMNPTNVNYKFRWECEDGTGAAVAHLASSFRCVHKEGFIISGKKSEMVFEYTPDSDMLMESFWRFHIPEYDLSIPFVLVGHVKEPRVYFDRTFCNFNSLLLNHKGTQTIKLVNKEHIPFAFHFNGRSYGADEVPPVVTITPSQGTVGPESDMELKVTFMPKIEKTYNYNAVCDVKKKATRLALNIKGEGFGTHATVNVEDETGVHLVTHHETSPIDFGEVHINETRVKTVSVTNSGKYPIEIEWLTGKTRLLTIKPERASIGKGEKVDVKLAFHPLTEASLEEHLAQMLIVNGPKYNFSVSGAGRKPLLAFSFTKLDFGACFLHRQGAQPAQAVLRLTNEDNSDVSYDVVFDNKPYLELDASPTNLSPGQSEEITITFMPRELRSYHEYIGFNINGLYTVNIEVEGSGHECDIALANPNQFSYNLGAVKVGTIVERRVKVKNSSTVFASCSIEAAAARLAQFDIQVRPTNFDLRPKETVELEMVFAPQSRILPFSEDLRMEVAGTNRTLMVLSASAVGVELKLESDMVFFGAIVKGTRTSRKMQLENVGDIGTKWRWAPGAFAPDFSVEPTEGFLNPHDETTLEFSFHPTRLNDDCRRDNLPLFIEGADPLNVTLTGICVSQEPQEGSISFDCPVRSTATKAIPAIKNPTDVAWMLHPVIDNEFWSGAKILEVPPGSEVAYELTYRPLEMTASEEEIAAEAAEEEERKAKLEAAAAAAEEEGEGDGAAAPPSGKQSPLEKTRRIRRDHEHKGSVFVPLPDGSAVMYQLDGKATLPESEGEKVEREVQCKATHTENLPVKNWLNRPQRFTVKIEPAPEGTTTIKGASYIDVPAHAERTYALKFHTYVPGTTEARVTLSNEATGEYLFFDRAFTAADSPVLSTFELSTVVRQGKEFEISLANPLSSAVVLKASCDNTDVVLDEEYELRPMGETPCTLTYRPLLPCKNNQALVKFTSAELGEFIYQLNLSAVSAGADRAMQFKAPLGGLATQTFRFRHYLESGTSYACQTEHPEVFTVAETVSAPAADGRDGVEVEVDVSFEPNSIGDISSRLTISSDEGGEYVCILNGYGLAPKPQGPIEVAGSASVNFKNPFTSPESFTVAVDSPAFSVSGSLDTVAPRQQVNISVNYTPPAPGVSLSGKMTVQCTRPGFPAWIFYLKGTG